jgi:hypothetical protein
MNNPLFSMRRAAYCRSAWLTLPLRTLEHAEERTSGIHAWDRTLTARGLS